MCKKMLKPLGTREASSFVYLVVLRDYFNVFTSFVSFDFVFAALFL